VLVYNADAGGLRVMRIVKANGFAVDEYASLGWRMGTDHTFDKRGLAGAVFTEEGMNFTAPNIQANAI
jgi:hypothetical protein